MAGLPDADQGGLSLPRFDSCGAACPRPGSLPRSRQARRNARYSGVAELLFQVSDVRAGTIPRARPVHSIDEAEEYPALDDGRGFDHAFGAGILRLSAGPLNDMKMFHRITVDP